MRVHPDRLRARRKSRGQALPFALVFLVVGAAALYLAFNAAQLAYAKTKEQDTADSAAYSVGVLQARGHRVALVTDGRMSGASGKVPAAIHVTPEAIDADPLGKLRDGDLIRLDTLAGTLEAKVDAVEWAAREQVHADLSAHHVGMGRELFASLRNAVGTADAGATIFARHDRQHAADA